MDIFLGKVTQQAMNYAIRSGVAITASYAIRQSTKLLEQSPKSTARDEYELLQQRLQNKIRIVSPAIDLIELIAARGNTSLESAVALTKELRLDIQLLGQRIAQANTSQAATGKTKQSNQAKTQNEIELSLISKDIKRLLNRIEDAVPLINLAITTSGASLSTSLPQTVSPSRLLQASTFLTAGDTQYSQSPPGPVQIGPTFTLTAYMLFAGHNRPQNEEEIRETTWKEAIHKARVKLRRVPLDAATGTRNVIDASTSAQFSSPPSLLGADATPSIRADARGDEFSYQMMIVEDFDDDRVHDFEDDHAPPTPFDDIKLAGIREMIPIHQISKIFYADTSKVLNIGSDLESNHPVLLLKRDLNAIPPRKMMQRETSPTDDDSTSGREEPRENHADRQDGPWRLPPSLDPEWIAFEVYSESEPSDDDSGDEDQEESSPPPTTVANGISQLADTMSNMRLASMSPSSSHQTLSAPPWVNSIQTSLSLLELLLRLTSLQQFQQMSHLSITDELLNFFLEESASTGAGGDENYRQGIRAAARRRVGWDPYDESPVKRRGEDYQYYSPSPRSQGGDRAAGWSPASVPPPQTVSPSPSPVGPTEQRSRGGVSRTSWLKREEGGRKSNSSPLRPQTAMTDEGIGTSPASGLDKELDARPA